MRIAPFALVAALLVGAASVSQAEQPAHVHRHSARLHAVSNQNVKAKHGKHGKHSKAGKKARKHGRKQKS